MSATRLKICGVTRARDVLACARLGADAVGLNFWPESKRHVDDATAESLARGWPAESSGMLRVGVFVDDEPARIAECVRACALDAVQLHGDRHPDDYEGLAELAGSPVSLCWVVRGTPTIDDLLRARPRRPPAWVLLDAAVPGFGGAGATTDWAWARVAVSALAPWPVWLAGGLNPGNAASAIEQVRPAGIDVASGAEAPGGTRGHKDPDAIAALVAICNNLGRERAGPQR